MAVIQLRKDVHKFEPDGNASAPKEVASLATDRSQNDLLSAVFTKEGRRSAKNIRVESTTQSAICCNDDKENSLLWANLKQGMCNVLDFCCQVCENSLQLLCIWPRAEDTFLGAPQLRRGNGFHRLCELLCIFNRPDTTPNVEQI